MRLATAPAALLAAAAVVSQGADIGDWTEVSDGAEWGGRLGFAAVALPDGAITITGGDAGSLVNDVWRSTDQGASWTEVSRSAPWAARYGHAAVALPDGFIVLMGGCDGTYFNDV